MSAMPGAFIFGRRFHAKTPSQTQSRKKKVFLCIFAALLCAFA
jgi:hypothetical protein